MQHGVNDPSGGVTLAAKTVSVIGLGKLGSPMAAVFAARGHNVVGVDLNVDVVKAVNEGRAPVREPQLQAMMDAGRPRLRATADFADAIAGSDMSFIVVPTPSGPDHLFSNRYVIDAIEQIGRALRLRSGYHLVVITSTVMPGSTDDVIRNALEAASGRKLGESLGLCYSPEFISLGSVVRDMLNPELILIGESDPRAGKLLEDFYLGVIESKAEVHRMNFVNAEICKIAINCYVTTKISFANMIADFCDWLPDADGDVVTKAMGADSRIGRKYLRGAIGYGGPCFPRDNKAFSALGRRLGVGCDLAEVTDQVNDQQIQRLVRIVEAHAQAGARVAILGMSYKPDTSVIDESQGVSLARFLANRGYRMTIADPQSGDNAAAVLGRLVELAPSASEAVAGADVVVITTPWPQFKEISWERDANRNLVIIDPWRIVDQSRIGEAVICVVPGRGACVEDSDRARDVGLRARA